MSTLESRAIEESRGRVAAQRSVEQLQAEVARLQEQQAQVGCDERGWDIAVSLGGRESFL
jgi:hypothetical protein